MSIVGDSKSARPELLLSRDINAAINITYWRLSSCWEKLVEGVLIIDFIENREQGWESFPGLWGVSKPTGAVVFCTYQK
ncbi:hypothetical protein BJJ97_08045 [Pectobacterium polaris]|nr:hypothetical protein BJJ97_08045 [Pectobacterium polaris]